MFAIEPRDVGYSGELGAQPPPPPPSTPLPPRVPTAHLLQKLDLLLFGVEDSQGLLMLQFQLLPPLCSLSHMLGGQGEVRGDPEVL